MRGMKSNKRSGEALLRMMLHYPWNDIVFSQELLKAEKMTLPDARCLYSVTLPEWSWTLKNKCNPMMLKSKTQELTDVNQSVTHHHEEICFISAPWFFFIESSTPMTNNYIQYLLSNRKATPFYNPQIFTNSHKIYFHYNASWSWYRISKSRFNSDIVRLIEASYHTTQVIKSWIFPKEA